MGTICNYGVYPFQDPLRLSDVYLPMDLNTFESNLQTIYHQIMDSEPKVPIPSSPDVSPKLFMRDVLTKYTVENIFTRSTESELIHIINTIMKKLYDAFFKKTGIRLYFVYRGGNILKLYKDNFERFLPGKVKDFFKDEFDPFFQTSDIDFYTVISNADQYKVEDLHQINIYIQTMCYYGCYTARILIMNHPSLFNFCRLNTDALSEEYQDLLYQMNRTKGLSDVYKDALFMGLGFNQFLFTQMEVNPDEVEEEQDDVLDNFLAYGKCGRFDLHVNPPRNEMNIIPYGLPDIFGLEGIMEEMVEKNGILDFYVSFNSKIQNKEEQIEFSLVRLMINYLVVYQKDGMTYFTNAPSELFDLSIGDPRDKMFYVYSADQLEEYQYSDRKDKIYIPSIEVTITDLIQILYKSQGFPWDDAKYEKRLYRLLVLILISQLTMANIEEIKEELEKEKEEINFSTLSKFNEEIQKRVKAKDKQKMEEYNQLFNSIVKKLLSVVDKVEQYMQTKGKLKKKDILL
jgi:hypothetical protein